MWALNWFRSVINVGSPVIVQEDLNAILTPIKNLDAELMSGQLMLTAEIDIDPVDLIAVISNDSIKALVTVLRPVIEIKIEIQCD